ncbi:MAG: ABC transporter ATP-binding protein [Coxiellaceae bacterium]|nr:ABC transporter ATP-binding protein [Coxiellaceae bacterium]
MSKLVLKNVCKAYQMGDVLVKALDDINLTINPGEYVAILGPSGSGKSTLMNLLGCLDTPTSGTYCMDGKDVSQLTRRELAQVRNQEIGFIFQSFNLLDYATALENVALPLIYRGIGKAEREAKAKQLLEQVGLGDRIHHKPNELSGGQRQRVAIARALVGDPHMILADEPTGNLDSESGIAIMRHLKQLSEQGKTIIVVTHDLELAKQFSRVIQIKDGQATATYIIS